MKLPVYMDHHATTPCDRRVVEKMLPFFSETFGNAGSTQHAIGETAARAVDEGRRSVAELLGASPHEIIFTGGATESDNLAVLGVAECYRDQGRHIITARTEHKAVLDACRVLEGRGFTVTYLPVDSLGRIDPDDVRRSMTKQTILVSLMLANNEIGTLQPIGEVGRVAKDRGVLFHCDAVQGVAWLPVNVEDLGVDLLSVTAHKMYGPKGIGALYVRKKSPRVRLAPLFHGGGQERGLRSGTLNVPGIVGFGEAAAVARESRSLDAARVGDLRNQLQERLLRKLDGVTVNGHPSERLCNNLHVSFKAVDAQALLRLLKSDVAVSAGATCSSTDMVPSHVLKAIGVVDELALASIRFGLGRFTTSEEVEFVAEIVAKHVEELRGKSPVGM